MCNRVQRITTRGASESVVNEKCSCEKEHHEHGYWIILGGRTFSHTVRMEDEEFNDGQGKKQRMSDGSGGVHVL